MSRKSTVKRSFNLILVKFYCILIDSSSETAAQIRHCYLSKGLFRFLENIFINLIYFDKSLAGINKIIQISCSINHILVMKLGPIAVYRTHNRDIKSFDFISIYILSPTI